MKKVWIALLLFEFSHSLNPIHEASWELRPEARINPSWTLQTGIYVSPYSRQIVRVPVSLSWPMARNFEIGAALKSRWLEDPNNFRHLIVGLKYRYKYQFSVQMDALWGTANYAGDGLTLSFYKRFNISDIFYANIVARGGMFDALVWAPDGFMAVETAGYPALRIYDPVYFELGIISSSQLGGFEDYFSLDLQPAITADLNNGASVLAGAIIGLAGPRKARLRVQAVVRYGI